MPFTGSSWKSLNRLPLLILICFVFVKGTNVHNLRAKDGIVVPDHSPQPRIPKRAFHSWLNAEGTPDKELADFMTGGAKDLMKKPRLMHEVARFRAKICWQMKDNHGKHFNSFLACKKFMEEACRPGGDLAMDGDENEISSGHGYCREYFPENSEEAKEIAEAEEKEEFEEEEQKEFEEAKAAGEEPEAEAVKGGSDEDVIEEEEAEEAEAAGKKDGKAAAKGGAAAPAAAPAGAAGAPGPAGAPASYPEDEAWYYKNGGKDPIRYHMSEEYKLPTHGYYGRLVEHDDMKTSSADWRGEYGDSNPCSVCKEHPDNSWCHSKGCNHHSGVSRSSVLVSAMFCIMAALAM